MLSAAGCVVSVAAQLLRFEVGSSQGDEEGGDTPVLEGLPEIHSTGGAHPHSVYVAMSTEGMPTLMDGQAPADMDRFKAWHMHPQYHALSHVSLKSNLVYCSAYAGDDAYDVGH